MNNCTKNDCGWCYDKSGLSNDVNGACLSPDTCKVNWPDDTHISNVAMNGECDQPVYEYKEQLWRMNPVGRYALYFQKGTWRESQQDTNETVLANGVML